MNTLKRSAFFTVVITSMVLLTGCLSGGGSDGGSSWGAYSSHNATAQDLINGLNSVDSQFADSYIVRDYWDSERTYVPGEEDWFVIWDAKYSEYKAVSLQYLRSLVYYDYYRNDTALADEFRDEEEDDINYGDYNGDYYGDDYEVADYDPYTDLYFGRNSGFAYEEDQQTYDVGLMQAESEERQFIRKATAISFEYEVSVETSMALITLGQKVESMMGKSGEITAEDQKALMGDVEHLTGATLEEMAGAATDEKKKEQLIEEIASEIGTNADSLEHRILPEVLNIHL